MRDNIVKMVDGQGNVVLTLTQSSFHDFMMKYNGKKGAILTYMMNYMDKRTNIFYGTRKSISEALDISQPTVAKALRSMEEMEVVRMIQNGVWQLDLKKIA